MIDCYFLAHPRSVGESYRQHFAVASRFGAALITGGVKAALHAVSPNTVRHLHAILVEKRGARRDAIAEMNTVEWMI